MAPKKPNQPGRKASGEPVAPAQYAKGMAQLRGLLEKAEGEVSELTRTATLIAEQIAALKSMVAVNAPLAEKLAKKMEQMSQSSSQEPNDKRGTRKIPAPEGKLSPPKKVKTPGKSTLKKR